MNQYRTTPIEAEQELAAAVASQNDVVVARTLERIGRSTLEFTGRCYADAICTGMCDTAVLFGHEGFHLLVDDEPAAQDAIKKSTDHTRGLRDFLKRYHYCHAQRSYYLQVVQSDQSYDALVALISADIGLSSHDLSELLSLAVRTDKVQLACLLVQAGAQLPDDIRAGAPNDLKVANNIDETHCGLHWLELATPRANLQMLAFILDQVKDKPVWIHRDWFKMYQRKKSFPLALEMCVLKSDAEHCEDIAATLATLIHSKRIRAIKTVLDWNAATPLELQSALEQACRQSSPEIAALIIRARQTCTSAKSSLKL